MLEKLFLCKDCHCCPAVELEEDKVRIGEEKNTVVLTREEWNILVSKIKSGELKEI